MIGFVMEIVFDSDFEEKCNFFESEGRVKVKRSYRSLEIFGFCFSIVVMFKIGE